VCYERALTTIAIIITGMFLAGSTWAAGYGTGVDEKTKELGGTPPINKRAGWILRRTNTRGYPEARTTDRAKR